MHARAYENCTGFNDNSTVRDRMNEFRPNVRSTGPGLQKKILRQSDDNAKVTIDLRRTSNLQNILQRTQGFS